MHIYIYIYAARVNLKSGNFSTNFLLSSGEINVGYKIHPMFFFWQLFYIVDGVRKGVNKTQLFVRVFE